MNKKPEPGEVERLQAAIEREQGVKQKFEQNLAADIAAQQENEKKQDTLAYEALGEAGNQDAGKRLEALEATLAKTAQRIVSNQKAIAVSSQKIAQLREAKNEAARREQLEKYEAETAGLMADGAELEKVLVNLTQAKGKLESRLESMDRLSFGLFDADKVPHRNIAKNLHWALEQRLKIPGPYRDHAFRERHRKPIDEMFARLLKHGTIEEPDVKQEQKAVGDNDEQSEKKKVSK
jgi:hypothetical protein